MPEYRMYFNKHRYFFDLVHSFNRILSFTERKSKLGIQVITKIKERKKKKEKQGNNSFLQKDI